MRKKNTKINLDLKYIVTTSIAFLALILSIMNWYNANKENIKVSQIKMSLFESDSTCMTFEKAITVGPIARYDAYLPFKIAFFFHNNSSKPISISELIVYQINYKSNEDFNILQKSNGVLFQDLNKDYESVQYNPINVDSIILDKKTNIPINIQPNYSINVTLYCKIKVEKYGVIDLDSLKEEPPKFISKKQYEDYMFCYDVLGNVAKNSSLIKYLPYFKILIKSTNDSEIEFTTFESTSYKYKEMKVQNTSIPLWAVDSIIKINSH